MADRTASRGSAYARPFTTSNGARCQRDDGAVAARSPRSTNDWWESTEEDVDDADDADDDDEDDADDEDSVEDEDEDADDDSCQRVSRAATS